jgi:hypothetical protein
VGLKPLASWVCLYVEQGEGPERAIRKNLIGSALLRSMWNLALTELDYKAGARFFLAKARFQLVPLNGGCQGQSQTLFATKRRLALFDGKDLRHFNGEIKKCRSHMASSITWNIPAREPGVCPQQNRSA